LGNRQGLKASNAQFQARAENRNIPIIKKIFARKYQGLDQYSIFELLIIKPSLQKEYL